MAGKLGSLDFSGKSLPQQLALVLMGVGGLAVLAGLWLLWSGMSGGDAGPTDNAARNSIDQIGATIDQVDGALGGPAVVDTARSVLSDPDVDIETLRRELQSAGVANLLDVRVFEPNVEDIEVGEYPEPDFSVVQMLLNARGQGSAPAEVHYPGTANENLAFSRALRENAPEGDPGPVAGYLFVRLPVSVVTRRLAQPGPDGWLALKQGETVIASNGRLAADRAPDGQATIAGSRLRLHWTAGGSAAGPSPVVGGVVVLTGMLLLGGGFVAGRDKAPARKTGDTGAVDDRPSDASGDDAQDLPDWMLDAGDAAANREDGASGDEEGSPAKASGGKRSASDLPFDVPDLDEIYEQIDADEERETGDGKGEARAEGKASPAPDEELPVAGEDFDFTEDSIDPDEDSLPEPASDVDDDPVEQAGEGGESAEPVSEEAEYGLDDEWERRDSSSAEDKGLDLDFAFSDQTGGDRADDADDLDTLLESTDAERAGDEAASESPTGEGLESALEDEQLTEPSRPPADEEDKDEDVFGLDDETPPAEPEPEPEPVAESEPEPEPEPEPQSEPIPENPAAAGDPDAPNAGAELPKGIFRPGDILGVVDEDLTAKAATEIGQAAGSIIAARGFSRVAVARDGRFSGPILLSALIRGLRNSGVDVVEIGAVPTPLLWFAAAELTEGCGVMVTGSHHPPKYNGFRVMVGGELLDIDGMADLARRVEQGDFAKGDGDYEQQDILQRYAKRLTADVQLERPLKVVVDCGNGVGGAVAPKLLQAIGADLIPLYCDVDGAFPNHRPDPSSPDDLEDLRLCVRNFQAEMGIAFDGDADRLALVTKNGEIVWPDRLMMLLADSVLASRPGDAVVFDVRSSGHLQSVVERAGGRGVMTATGQQAVAQRLRDENAPLGGDMNGHLFINDRWYPFDDALYAAARLLEVLAADTRDVDEILAEQPQFRASPEIVVNVEREQAQSLIERLGSESDFGDALITRTDGVRADWSDRWGLARVDADTGRLILRFGADEATALGRVRSEFRDKLLELEPKLPLPY